MFSNLLSQSILLDSNTLLSSCIFIFYDFFWTRYATIYLFFALSGLVDILVYYCGYSVLPEGIQSFLLSLAFGVEGFLFTTHVR